MHADFMHKNILDGELYRVFGLSQLYIKELENNYIQKRKQKNNASCNIYTIL